MNEQVPSKERVLPKTDLEWIAHTLGDAEAAIKVLSTMLAKEGLKMGFAVADEILGNVRSAQKNCSHLIERERRTAHEPCAGCAEKQATIDHLMRTCAAFNIFPTGIKWSGITKEVSRDSILYETKTPSDTGEGLVSLPDGFPCQQMEASTTPLTHQEIFSAVHHHASEIVRLTAAVPTQCTGLGEQS